MTNERENITLKKYRMENTIKKFVWTKEEIYKISIKSKSRSEFKKNASGAYHAARKNGWLEELCSHMTSNLKKAGYWDSKDLVMHEALKYFRRVDFKKKSSAAAASAVRNGWYEEACLHMQPVTKKEKSYWNSKLKVLKEARKYSSRGIFGSNAKSAYHSAIKHGWLEEACSHMQEKIKPKYFWENYENVAIEAMKYTNKTDFRVNSSRAYLVAKREGWLSELSLHMNSKKVPKMRGLYAFEFSDYSVYVGLTGDYKTRFGQHLKKSKFIKSKIKKIEFSFVTFDIYYEEKKAGQEEANLIEVYKLNGWKILNKAKAGGLGGSSIQWDLETTHNEALKYKTRKEFEIGSPGAYAANLKNKWSNIVCSHMPKKEKLPNGYWKDFIKVKKESLKFNERESFKKGSPGAYRAAIKYGWYEEVCSHMNYTFMRPGHWNNKELVFQEARKYSTRFEFQKKSASARGAAVRNGWLEEACSHMKSPLGEKNYWNKFNRVKAEALKYNSRSEFGKKSYTAYKVALKNKWLQKVCSHMTHYKIWTKYHVKKEALKYKRRSEFNIGSSGAYSAARSNGWLDEVCKHMSTKKTKRMGFWNELKNIEKEALKYKTRNKFKKGSKGAYEGAVRNGWLNNVCSHMMYT